MLENDLDSKSNKQHFEEVEHDKCILLTESINVDHCYADKSMRNECRAKQLWLLTELKQKKRKKRDKGQRKYNKPNMSRAYKNMFVFK